VVLFSCLATVSVLSRDSPQASAGSPAGQPPQYLPISAVGCLAPPAAPTAPLAAGPGSRTPPVCIELEVPRTDRQYAMGLQMRPPLPPLRGMWFPYTPASLARFWMHRTPEPLDMLFVRDGRVVLIEARVPPCMRLPCRSYGPDWPVEGVLELGGGEAERLGIGVGRAIRLMPVPARH
jgi:uncharacterized protein